MGDPDSAIDRANADRAVTPGQNLAGRTVAALLFMRPVVKATFAEQRAEDAGGAVRRAKLAHDRRRCVLQPIDGTVGLPHRRPQTAARIRRNIAQLLGSPGAGLELPDSIRATASSTPRKAASVT